MADLVRGRFHVTDPVWSYLGQPVNATQNDIAYRTNAHVLGLSGLADTGSLVASGVQVSVPIPVEAGDVITKVTFLIGATAASTPTHSFVALYSGVATPALLAQSADATTGAIAASGAYVQSLQTAQTITTSNAPFGFVYASLCVTGTAVPSVATVAAAAAVGYQWFTNSPVKMVAVSHGSAQGATAAATIASPTALANTPIAFLS